MLEDFGLQWRKMLMKIKKVKTIDSRIERKIITGLIVSEEYSKKIIPFLEINKLQVSFVKTIAGWCIDYYKENEKALGRTIDDIYKDKVAEGFDDDAYLIRDFLISISREYERDQEFFNVPYYLKQTEKYLSVLSLKQLSKKVEKCSISGDIEKGESIIKGYESFRLSETDESCNSLWENISKLSEEKVKTYDIAAPYDLLNEKRFSVFRDGVIVLGGEASSGKTSLLTDICISLLSKNSDMFFLFYTLDDAPFVVGRKIVSQLLDRNFIESTLEVKFDEDEKDLLNRIYLKDKFDIADLEANILKFKNKSGCNKVIVGIDYFQTISSNDSNNSQQRDSLNEIFGKIKDIHKKFIDDGCIFFVLSQFNRDSSNNTFRYRETSEIENKAEVCLDLHLRAENKKQKEFCEKTGRRLTISKNKLFERGKSWEAILQISSRAHLTNFKFDLQDLGETDLLSGKSSKKTNLYSLNNKKY